MNEQIGPSVTHGPKVQVVITDARVFVSSHCWHAPTCVSVTAAVQTFARVCAFQGLLSEPVEMTVGEQPTYDVRLVEKLEARQAVAGFLSALYGMSKTKADTIVVSDNRKQDDAQVPLPPPLPVSEGAESVASGGYAETLTRPVHKLIDGSSAEARA